MIPSLSYSSSSKNSIYQNSVVGKRFIVLALEILLAIPLGLILSQFHLGTTAWIFGGAAAGVTVLQFSRLFYDYCPKPNRIARKVGLALVGIMVGFASSHSNLAHITANVPVFVVLTAFLLLCGTAIGYIYSRLSQTNILTAMLATVPGGVGIMAAIAADYGKNVTLVAMVQAIRVTSVVLLIPLVARTSTGTFVSSPTILGNGHFFSFQAANIGLLGLLLVLTGVGVYLAKLCKVPASDFFGALMVAIAFNSMLNVLPFVHDINFSPPRLIQFVGQLLLGVTIGEYWGNNPNFGKKTIGYGLMCVVMTLTAGAIATIIAMQLTSWDWLTCLLVTAPGGSAEIILVALGLHHNVDIVTAGHLVRLIAINSSLPLWLFLFRRLDGSLESVSD
ncbi:MAG: AbrB family transcriptional regulator [Calothrix sp. MO_192.B10]|nr:AbrB family transcriptional regulator [Calothrix sp. MO_192.B10]